MSDLITLSGLDGSSISRNFNFLSSDGTANGTLIAVHCVANSIGDLFDPATAQNQTVISNALSTVNNSLSTISGTLSSIQTTVSNYSTVQFFETNAVLTANSTFTGSSHDTGAAPGAAIPYNSFNGYYYSDQSGTGYIEGSNDDVNWFPVVSGNVAALTPLVLTTPVLFRYNRVSMLNTSGSTQNTCVVNASFSG